MGIGLYGLTYIYPVYLGRIRGYDSLMIGETMFVSGLAMFFTAPIAGRLSTKMDLRLMMVIGFVSFAAGTFIMLYDPSHYVLQCLDYLDNIDIYKDRIKMFHVKDAEFNPTGRQGVYGGYQGWVERAGRFRSLGDGQVDFGAVFSKMTANNFDGWAVVEWECALKHPEDGAREGAEFVAAHIIRVTEKAFDDFAGSGTDQAANRRMLGL